MAARRRRLDDDQRESKRSWRRRDGRWWLSGWVCERKMGNELNLCERDGDKAGFVSERYGVCGARGE
ncbi:hypothetical protein ACOSP7_023555 [Xanthoceras sorbifolium]